MQPAGIIIKDPMKTNENGKSENKSCCCFPWNGRKVKPKENPVFKNNTK